MNNLINKFKRNFILFIACMFLLVSCFNIDVTSTEPLFAETTNETSYFESIARPATIKKNLLVLSYSNPENAAEILDWYNDQYTLIGYSEKDIEYRTFKLIDYIRCGSTWHGEKYYNCYGGFALNYSVYDFVYDNGIPPYGDDGTFDYGAVYEKFDICNLIKEDKIDEIWIWESGNGKASESVTSRSKDSTGNPLSVNMPPSCGKTVTILNFNYMRSIDLALHTYGHRIERAMWFHHFDEFGCGYIPSEAENGTFTSRPSPENNYIGTCGDIHRPPNVYTTADLEYIYDSPAFAVSTCNTWEPENNGMKEIISCKDWGCHPGKYYIWWMQHIPPNWWGDLFE